MIVDGGHILCQISKQCEGDTKYSYTASIDNKLTKLTRFYKYAETPWAKDHENIGKVRKILLIPCY